MNGKDVTLKIGPETGDVADAVKDLILDIRAGKSIALIATENIPGLIKVVDGADKIDDELKSELRNATVAYVGLQIVEALTVEVEKVK